MWDEVLVGATAVVSTLGGFGNEEQMKRINGEANILAVGAAKDFGEYSRIKSGKIFNCAFSLSFELFLFSVLYMC